MALANLFALKSAEGSMHMRSVDMDGEQQLFHLNMSSNDQRISLTATTSGKGGALDMIYEAMKAFGEGVKLTIVSGSGEKKLNVDLAKEDLMAYALSQFEPVGPLQN